MTGFLDRLIQTKQREIQKLVEQNNKSGQAGAASLSTGRKSVSVRSLVLGLH